MVIIGAGPGGCALACLLARRGIRALVFDDDKRPDLLVGESLVPAAIPLLRKLGVEERVAEFSVMKPGASFFHGDGTRVHLKFQKGRGSPGYAYNVPRPQFDNLLRERAEELGVEFVDARGCVKESVHPDRELELTAESLEKAGFAPGEHPGLVVDASGRTRLIARTLKLDAERGGRADVSYFAHYENFAHDEVDPGGIIISVLDRGWSWRIPLQGRMSVGIVIDKESAKELGDTPEERLDNAIKCEPLLKKKGGNAKRVTDVMVFSKYQRISKCGYGKGWVMLGDAFGFVDPMLSPGLFMALESAYLLDRYVFAKAGVKWPKDRYLDRYCRELRDWHESWQELIDYFYDGRLLRLSAAGMALSKGKGEWSPAKIMERHMIRVIQAMAAGFATRSRYNRMVLRRSCEYLVWDVPDAEYYSVK